MINKDTYKRLTNKNLDEFNPKHDFCIGCKEFGEPNGCNRWNGACANYKDFNELYNRLAELEDKIENGTIVEIPPLISYNEHLKKYEVLGYDIKIYVKKYCKTKAEAEARLKELQEGKK